MCAGTSFWASPAADGLWPGRGGIGSVSGIKKNRLGGGFFQSFNVLEDLGPYWLEQPMVLRQSSPALAVPA